MNLEKKISALLAKLVCFLIGHTQTVICERCGKLVDEEANYNVWKRFRLYTFYGKVTKEHKGSLKIKTGCKKYELDLKTNELRLLKFKTTTEKNNKGVETGNVRREAEYKPTCVYIDASNDKNAIRKANNYIFSIKTGVRITEVTK